MFRNTIRPVAGLFLVAAYWLIGSASPALAQPVNAQQIFVQNDTTRTVWVAIRYKPPGTSSYITDGFWSVEPGQRRHLINNGDSRIIYVHVHDDQGVIRGKGAPIHQTVRGHAVELYPEDTRDDYDPWTIRIYNR